jgi:hypothetical protein
MDRLDKYRDVIKKILTEYHSWATNSNIRECLKSFRVG